MTEKFQDKRISEALELLDEVAKENRADFQRMVSGRYSNLKSLFGGVADRSQHQARETYAQGQARVKDPASKANRNLQTSSRHYLRRNAPVLLTLGYIFTLGYFLGRSRR